MITAERKEALRNELQRVRKTPPGDFLMQDDEEYAFVLSLLKEKQQ